jgi:RNA polymerase sigma factor (sigma-70 family)
MMTRSDTTDDRARRAAEAYREVLPMVLAMARNKGLSAEDQREMAQEVGAVLAAKIDEYDPARGSLRMWGAGIARRVILETKRTARTERRSFTSSRSVKHLRAPDLTPEQAALGRQALALVRAAVREDCRVVFDLDAQGYTAPEIGALLGLPETTVVGRLKQARADLNRALAKMTEDDKDPTRLRAVILPFASVEDVSRALRIPELSRDAFDQLWRDVLERVEQRRGVPDDAPATSEAPEPAKTAGPPRLPRAPVVPDGFAAPLSGGMLARLGPRVALSAAQLATAGFVVFAAGAVAGIASTMLHAPAETPRPSIVADVGRVPPLSTAEGLTPLDRDHEEEAAPAGERSAPSSTPRTRPAPGANPATMDEGDLLRAAMSAAPAEAIMLLRWHARRFPSQQVKKRETILAGALASLGRAREAGKVAEALQHGAYEHDRTAGN